MTTPYEPRTWVDGDTGGTALSAANLNHLEQGVAAVSTALGGKAGIDPETGKVIADLIPPTAPAPHTHEVADVEGLLEFAQNIAEDVSTRAPAGHTHQIEDVLGLEDMVNAKPTIVWGTGNPTGSAPAGSLFIDTADPNSLKLWRMS